MRMSTPSSPTAPGRRALAAVAVLAACAAAGVTSAGPAAVAAPAATTVSHVDNPYRGVRGYVDPQWRADAVSVPGGHRVANTPTAVWLDRLDAVDGVDGRMGLRAHLEAALAQGAGYVQVVVHDLPGRDCSRLTSTGDLAATELPRYRSEFIDRIAAIEGDPAFRRLRIVNVIEPGWLQSLVAYVGATPIATPECEAVRQSGAYLQGVQYAVATLHGIGPNSYTYLDAGNHGELGWDSLLPPAVQLIAEAVRTLPAGYASIDGLAVNTAGYNVVTEPYFTADTVVFGTPVRWSRWVDWNSFVDELPYAQRLRTSLVSLGFSPSIGVLVDTSRNGWGGPQRPTGPSLSTDVNTFVDESRTDRRLRLVNRCNQVGAGLGERPRVAPAAGIDAYTWIKQPGVSDGAASAATAATAYDPMCDPYADWGGSTPRPTGAMPDAPAYGTWFPAAFAELMANAYPPLS